MTEVLEIEKVKQNSEVLIAVKDTRILLLPTEICRREGCAEGTMITLTLKNGAIKSSIINPNPQFKESAKRFIGKYGDFMK
jgi:hypothetical protein